MTTSDGPSVRPTARARAGSRPIFVRENPKEAGIAAGSGVHAPVTNLTHPCEKHGN